MRAQSPSVVPLPQLENLLDNLLQPERFSDYAPNGLQVEGRGEVGVLVSGVSASLEFVRAAIKAKADAVLVHHGWFWQGESRTVRGAYRERIKLLLENDISLFGYHLPLDAHPELGNNAQLAKKFGWRVTGMLEDGPEGIGFVGELEQPLSIDELAHRVEQELQRTPLVVGSGPSQIRTVGWCSGAAQNRLDLAIERGCDAYLTGEISEQHYHAALENGIYFIAAGHHATERYGVQAVGAYVQAELGVQHQYIEIPNPV